MKTVTIYIRLRQKFQARLGEVITINKAADIIAPKEVIKNLGQERIHTVTKEDSNYIVIDVMDVIQKVYQLYSDADIQAVGPSQTIIEVEMKRQRKRSVFFFLLVWVLLFIGAGLAIINFHEDVAMQSVHQKIYTIVTGRTNSQPLLLQIPYSLGLAVGMILFFNHVFKKKFNEEPSPLEIEMFNYQQDLDQYVIINEKKKKEADMRRD
ncbi:stage V sporulation protein AA [Terrilactibacillus sp. S3-3]|nr:stage V sporulation protein AA [Terrilactibacillus sp. S3-3]